MVRYRTIIKVMDDEVNKCKITQQAKEWGNNGVWSTEKNEWGEDIHILTYPDGTRLTYDEIGFLRKVEDASGFSADYGVLENDSVAQFNEFHNHIRELYGEEGFQLYMDYTNFKMSTIGMYYNSYLRGTMTRDEFYSKVDEWVTGYSQYDDKWARGMTGTQVADYLISNGEQYEAMCRDTSLNGYGDFATVRQVTGFHQNDHLDKRIVSDKGYTSSSVAMSSEEIDETLDMNGSWTIITKYKDGNPANRGLYLGYPEYKNMGFNCWYEVLNAPGQKMMRTHIDVDNRIIVQEPYEP